MLVFTNPWDYLLYTAIMKYSIWILYAIALVIYFDVISTYTIKYAFKAKLFDRFGHNGPFSFVLFVINLILSHIATIGTGWLITYLTVKFDLY